MTDEARYASNFSWCESLVKNRAEDLYLAAGFASQSQRETLIIFYAFACEILQIPEAVSEPTMGMIRQQWWRDALAEVFSDQVPRAHPVVEAMKVRLGERKHVELQPSLLMLIDRVGPLIPSSDNAHKKISPDMITELFEAITAVALDLCAPELTLQSKSDLSRLGGYWAQSKNLMSQTAEREHSTVMEIREGFDAWRRKIGSVDVVAIPAVLHASLVPLYLAEATSAGQEETSANAAFRAVHKRFRLFRAVLVGHI